jgi:hypothetical protein
MPNDELSAVLARVHEADEPPAPNGARAYPDPPKAGEVKKKRLAWITLPRASWDALYPPEVYADYPYPEPPPQFLIWVSFKRRYLDDIRSGDAERASRGLREIVLKHTGWIDPDTDAPVPPADSDEFWEDMTDSMAAVILTMLTSEVGKVSSSATRTLRR